MKAKFNPHPAVVLPVRRPDPQSALRHFQNVRAAARADRVVVGTVVRAANAAPCVLENVRAWRRQHSEFLG